MQIKRIFLSLMTLSVVTAQCQYGVIAKGDEPRFAGVEFYGSSQVTKLELEKMLGIKPGASASATESARKRIEKQLEARHLDARVEVVQESGNELYVVVDLPDSGEEAPLRRFNAPHHVSVRTEKPFIVLADLKARIAEVEGQGRDVKEIMNNGFRSFSDEPCNQFVTEIRKYAGVMREELIAVVDADPSPERRVQAIELLGWAGEFPDSMVRVIPAIDDVDPEVRASADRFIFPRLALLPPNFPYQQLVAAWSRQITRRSHEDRAKGLYCLLALCTVHPQVIHSVRLASATRVQQLATSTILPTVKNPADQLLVLFAKDAKPKPTHGLPFLQGQD
ncbi:MAG TPA: hypothetical protein V6C81_24575 [Planktothrix sp.]